MVNRVLGTRRAERGKAERVEVPPDCFELVFSVDVIDHLGNRLRYLGEGCGVL